MKTKISDYVQFCKALYFVIERLIFCVASTMYYLKVVKLSTSNTNKLDSYKWTTQGNLINCKTYNTKVLSKNEKTFYIFYQSLLRITHPHELTE